MEQSLKGLCLKQWPQAVAPSSKKVWYQVYKLQVMCVRAESLQLQSLQASSAVSVSPLTQPPSSHDSAPLGSVVSTPNVAPSISL